MSDKKNILGVTESHAHTGVHENELQDVVQADTNEVNARTAVLSALIDKALRQESDKEDTPSNMNKLFANKERTFWVFQIAGWLGYLLVRMFQGLTMGNDLNLYIWIVFPAMFSGLVLTSGIRYIYRQFRHKPLTYLLIVAVLVSGSAGMILSLVDSTIAPMVYEEDPYQGIQRLGNAMFLGTVILAWSAIYFGYHFYEDFQEQQGQVLKANAMAHQAQLKMLRYQLNPHFLFNTLNAISTLVLEKATDEANLMVTKLSSFLRYTLVNQLTQKVTVEQELYALGLYLDIEKVRFEDRLNVKFDIDARVKTAVIPSMILQPLIENAIKYAVAPSIDGGEIKVVAMVRHHKLVLQMLDNGPGIPDLNNIVGSSSGSGVGLANTHERLSQIYKENHEIMLDNRPEGGLSITMILPLEREEQDA